MRKLYLLSIAIILSIIFVSAIGANSTLFTKDIQITYKDKKVKIDTSFKAATNQGAKIVVTNGYGWNNVKKLKVKLNGKTVIGKKQVNANVDSYTAIVTLEKNNSLKIVARKQGTVGRVKIEIIATDDGGGDGDDGDGDDGDGEDDTPPEEKPIFKRILGYGDSLLAGFIDGTLLNRYQKYNFGSLIAKQAKTSFNLPLIEEPGNPSLRAELVNGNIKFYDEEEPGQRVQPNLKLNNFAVPGATARTSLYIRATGGAKKSDPYTIVLGGKKTMIESVKDREGSLVILWIGSNDVLGMLFSNNLADHTNLNDFAKYYEEIIKELKKSTTRVVAANIPDITITSYLVDVDEFTILDLYDLPNNAKISAISFLKLLQKPLGYKFNDEDIFTQAQLNKIQDKVEDFNKKIKSICKEYDVPLVDMFSISQRWNSNGVSVAGQHLTTKFMKGIFGLDGIHPTITAHALIANEFIKVINKEWKEDLKTVNEDDYFFLDPNQSGRTGVPSLDEAEKMLQIMTKTKQKFYRNRHLVESQMKRLNRR